MSRQYNKKIMVLDGYSSRTLACVRSFGKTDVEFVVGGHGRTDMSLLSKYARTKFTYTSPFISIEKFISNVCNRSKQYGSEIIFPTSEAAMLALSQYRKHIDFELFMPQDDQLNLFTKKYNTIKYVREINIPIPETSFLTEADVDKIKTMRFEYPIILKPNSSFIVEGDQIRKTSGFLFLRNQYELSEQGPTYLRKNKEVLAQKFIIGPGIGISGIFNEGEPVCLFAHQRLHESNPMGGPSALAISREIGPSDREMVKRIMQTTKLTGPAMLEFKRNDNDELIMMEINGRLWGSVLLPLRAGLDMPKILLGIMHNQSTSSFGNGYQDGLVGRYLVGDTKWLYLTLKGKPVHWPIPYKKKSKALTQYIGSFFDRSTKHLILDMDDPLPFIGRILQEIF